MADRNSNTGCFAGGGAIYGLGMYEPFGTRVGG